MCRGAFGEIMNDLLVRESVLTGEFVSQANKCIRWMPRHKSAMKDVASCEKPRGAASERRSGGIRMGQPGGGHTLSPSSDGANPGN